MAVALLARPTAIPGSVIAGDIAGTGTPNFFIKVKRYRLSISTRLADVTGDGDDAPSWLPSYFPYADLRLIGWMVAAQALGLANLIDSTKNPTADSTSASITLQLDLTREFNGRFALSTITVDWDRTAPYVAIALAMKGTVLTTGATSLNEATI